VLLSVAVSHFIIYFRPACTWTFFVSFVTVSVAAGLCLCVAAFVMCSSFVDGYCSTLQGVLDWFEVDLGFTELLFVMCSTTSTSL